ncbi:MAG: P-II family nitrogen regulator [Oscillospiraceae bacterium]|nr:P-II family nitrogen regulator [Oscillospiraceae bacterium]
MKRIEILINPEKRDRLEEAIENYNVSGVIFSHVIGYGNQKGRTTMFRGSETKAHCLTKLRAETVVPDDRIIGVSGFFDPIGAPQLSPEFR